VTPPPFGLAGLPSLVFIKRQPARMEPLRPLAVAPAVHATVIDYLAAAGAKVIAYDVLFPERDLRKFMVANTEWTGEESDAALVESTRKAGNVVHVAEAASAELIDPSRAVAEDLTAPALNVKLTTPACVQTALTAVRPGCARRLAHLVHPGWMVRSAHRAGGGWCAPFLVIARGDCRRRDGVHGQRRRGPVRRWCRGEVAGANGQPTFTSTPSTICSARGNKSARTETRSRSVAVRGSHRDRRLMDGLPEVFTTPFRWVNRGPESARTATQCWRTARLPVATSIAVASSGRRRRRCGGYLGAWLTGAVHWPPRRPGLAVAGLVRARLLDPRLRPALAIFIGDRGKCVVEGREKRQVKLFSATSRRTFRSLSESMLADSAARAP
jgi:hypothetical protein